MSLIIEVTANLVTQSVTEILNKYTRELIKEKRFDPKSDIVSDESELYLTKKDFEELNTQEEKEVIEKSSISIDSIRGELLRQAKVSFNCAIFTILMGVVLIIIGAIFLISNNITVSIFTSITGAISEFLSFILIKFSNRCNDKIDKIKKDLNKLENAKTGLMIIDNIKNSEDKDKALKILVDSISKNISDVA